MSRALSLPLLSSSALLLLSCTPAQAQDIGEDGKLLLTNGVTTLEGAAGDERYRERHVHPLQHPGRRQLSENVGRAAVRAQLHG